ncbi:MAG: hypothetical protein ABH835_01340 [Patescibacteria group bacterium]|nr:hypothetical protein [Patescibacteria group bacterium]
MKLTFSHIKLSVFCIGILLLLFGVFFTLPVQAQDQKNIYLFHGQGCPHCADLKIFLETLKDDYPEMNVVEYEVWYDKANAEFYEEFSEAYGMEPGPVPRLFIGEEVIEGYFDDETTGAELEEIYASYTLENYPDPLEKLKKYQEARQIISDTEETQSQEPESSDQGVREEKIINFPIIGIKDVSSFSLPVLTISLGLLDGFNPCAMWVLLFLISLLLNTNSRKKMWIIGGIFLLTSGIVYYFFMVAWLNIFLFISYMFIIRLIIGALAIIAGYIHIKDFFKYKDGECKVDDPKSKKKLMDRAVKIVSFEKITPAVIIGIIGLAFSVNLIELFCSAGLPAIYTSILSFSNLSTAGYYGYMALYTLFYMLDDTIVFLIAMATLSMVSFTGKFSRWSNLVGGILILILGLIMLIKPDLLMLG